MSMHQEARSIERVASLVQKVISQPSTHFLNNIIDAINDPVFVKDDTCHFLLVNEAFCQFVCHSREELLGHTDTDFFPLEQCEVFYTRDRHVFATRQPDVNEELLIGADGHNRIIRTTKTVFEDANGRLVLVGIITDLTDLRNAQRELETANVQLHRLAHLDPLTGLPNRMAFEAALRSTIKQAQRHHEPFSLLFMDLNGFKSVNDTHGHPAGDELIVRISERLQATLRDGDTVARLGGDEFVVIARQTSGDQARLLAQRLAATIRQPVELSLAVVEVSTSIGISRFPEDGDCAVDLIKNADMAMYRAKRVTRNPYEFFDQHFARLSNRRNQLQHALKTALSDVPAPASALGPGPTLVAWFQPLVDLHTGSLRGYEALARLNDPVLGAIPPTEFVAIAEQSSLIDSLGDSMLRQACQVLASQPDLAYISVNVSNVQLRNPSFVVRLQQILQKSGISGHRLALEITESCTAESHAVSTLRALAELGVRVWIDDFGTGYSNLSLLRKLPLYGLKIDRAFIADLVESSADQTIVRAVLAIARELGLVVIAEGVETTEQRDLLKGMGVELGQGYLFARPAPWQTPAPLPADQCPTRQTPRRARPRLHAVRSDAAPAATSPGQTR